jgi:hypothetical protein
MKEQKPTIKPRTIKKKEKKIRGNENGRARRLAGGAGGGFLFNESLGQEERR